MSTLNKNKLQSENVFDELKRQIIGGEYPAGSNLPSERNLSEVLGVHRSTVREAIKRLEQVRLVQTSRGGGSKIQDFKHTAGMDLLPSVILRSDGTIDSDVILHLTEMRQDLLPIIVERAIERNGETLAALLAEIIESMRQAKGDLEIIQSLCITFWDSCIDCADNLAYRFTFNTMHENYRQFAAVMQVLAKKELTSLHSYDGIYLAVRAKDATSAKRITSELLSKSGKEISRAVAKYQKMLDRTNVENNSVESSAVKSNDVKDNNVKAVK